MKKILILVLAILIAVAALLFSRMNSKNDASQTDTVETVPAGEEPAQDIQTVETSEPEVTEDGKEDGAEEEVSGMEIQEETEIIIEEEGEETIGF